MRHGNTLAWAVAGAIADGAAGTLSAGLPSEER